jgi:GTP-binding protein
MFRDEVTIRVKAGNGGDGCVSFRREKRVPRGGPNGGDGGRGGHIHLVASAKINTLSEFWSRRIVRAPRGGNGQGSDCFGRKGKDITLKVPLGTVVRDADRGHVLKDFQTDGERLVAARGGAGGRGNMYFASPTNRAPRTATPGRPGEESRLHLELKLIADVGLVGLPNAGKSTFLSRVSRARPKVAAYPFTTLRPILGIVHFPDFRDLVVADLPGLIEGAHEGRGLGDQFLRHVERTKVLLHLVDASPDAMSAADEAWRVIRRELALHSKVLAEKPEVVAATKTDLPGSAEGLRRLRAAVGAPVHAISAMTGKGVGALLQDLARLAAGAGEIAVGGGREGEAPGDI